MVKCMKQFIDGSHEVLEIEKRVYFCRLVFDDETFRTNLLRTVKFEILSFKWIINSYTIALKKMVGLK